MSSRSALISLAFVGFSASSLVAVGVGFSLPACNLKANTDGCGALTSNSADGVTACGAVSCGPGTYCANDAGSVCGNGCTESSQCTRDEKCDLSNAQTDLGGHKVGSCVSVPLSEQSSPCASGDGGSIDGSAEGGDAGGVPRDAGRD